MVDTPVGQEVWVWCGHVWSDRTKLALWEHGDKITDVSVFCQRVDAQGNLTQTFDPDELLTYREKWPHLRFWLGFRNDGIGSIFLGLMGSSAARTRLAAQLGALLDKYEWMVGIDIDLEKGGAASNATAAEQVFRQVAAVAHGRGLKCAAALPPLTATGSVGGEDWVRYRQLGAILDHVEIMSYDFAWRGSAPGPTSPGYWMRNVYNWATSQIVPSKISWGLPLYAYFWNISEYSDHPQGWRGTSGPFYAAYGIMSGHLALDGTFANPAGSGNFDRIGWIVYRHVDSQMCWGLIECYDFVEVEGYESARGVTFGSYETKGYAIRPGQPGGIPIWSIADNGPGNAEINYKMIPRSVIAEDGQRVEPKTGYNMTVEVLKRYPVAATIIDDYATSSAQLSQVYNVRSGSWSYWNGSPSQYRGSGRLDFNHVFAASQSLYVQARFQMAASGVFRLYCRGIQVNVNTSGLITMQRNGVTIGQTTVPSIPTGAAAGEDYARRVVGLRVRENTARVYFANSEQSIPRVLEINTTPLTGTESGRVGMGSSVASWIDHTYLGDGWWYQPREAVQVTVGSTTRTLGRLEREDIRWDGGMFRPNKDVDERDTRTKQIGQDWDYDHWVNVPVTTDQESNVKIVPLDHDAWIGRTFLFNRAGGNIVYWTDPNTISYWRSVAGLDYGCAGVALWTVGQEDLRCWDALGGGELSEETRIVNG